MRREDDVAGYRIQKDTEEVGRIPSRERNQRKIIGVTWKDKV